MSNPSPSKTREVLVNDIDRLKRDAVKIASDVQDHANAHFGQVRQRANDTVESVRDALTSAPPLALVGIGFAIGLFLGFRLRR